MDSNVITPTVVFAGLVGAIIWNLVTWYFGLPSSSSHALIGGVVGAAFAQQDEKTRVIPDGKNRASPGTRRLSRRSSPSSSGRSRSTFIYGIVARERRGPVNRGFRLRAVVSGGMLALAHGTNDAQKTMGVITLALIANGNLPLGCRGCPHTGWCDRPRPARSRSVRGLGRVEDHPHDGQPDHQDGRRAGVLGPGRRRRGDPRVLPLRLSRSRPRT